jgi:pyruvate/2-oxoglutarate dehydrogenase complex dihydrolipoamide dehydrogenase (E3) component
MKTFDAIIIGAGQAGVPLAKKLAAQGWKTALIEKRLVGGTCINDGCTPTKTLVASARMAYKAANSEELGVEIDGYTLNFKKIMARKAAVVKQFHDGAVAGVEGVENLTLVMAEASFLDAHTLQISGRDGTTQQITAKHIFINTGASPVIPDTEGLKEVNYLTSTTILELEEVPEHLLIVGSGYIGLEYAQMFRRFGARVTLLERSERLMPKEDDDVCQELTDIFKAEEIDILIETKATKFTAQPGGGIEVDLEVAGAKRSLTCSHVLVASGRKPQTETLGLENAGITCDDHGHVDVNEFLETNVEGVYALGDVKGGPAFTHISYNDFVIISRNLLEGTQLSTTNRQVPYCMFTDPQVGRIGVSEMDAIAQGLSFIVAKIPMKNVARAIENGETRGFMKAIVDKETRLILGATIIGEQGGEIMSVLQMAMMGGITCDEISTTVFAHPLYAESLNNLFLTIAE